MSDVSEHPTSIIAGTDEAGRGPLAGPVVAAAVILDPTKPISGITDSKKLTPKRRELLFDEICESALSWCIELASVEEIDELNILHASMLAMSRSVSGLSLAPDKVLVDGNRCPDVDCPAEAIVGGDLLVAEIGAASILAKVTRDRMMINYDVDYPEYGFAQHKGYPTKKHREALAEFGPCDIHRRSFAPVAKYL